MTRRSLFCPALLLAFFPVALSAQTPKKRALQIEDYYRVKTVGAPRLSADELYVTFNVTTRVEETNGNTNESWRVRADGSRAAERVTPAVDTPAGAGRGGPGGGGGQGGAGGGRGSGASITSPDGQWVATVRDVDFTRKTKPTFTEFEKRHEQRFKGAQFDWMEFHRDGAAFPTPNAKDPELNPPQEIFLQPTGGNASAITKLGLRPTGVQWVPDNSGVIFSADSTYRDELSYGRTDIWSVTRDGMLRRLTPRGEFDYNGARLSPDGRILMATRQLTRDHVIAKKLDHGGAVDIVVMSPNGSGENNLTETWDYLPSNVQWSPDNKYIYFEGGVGGTTQLFRVSPNGGGIEQLTKGQRNHSGITFNKAFTKIVYTVGVFEKPSDVFIANVDGTDEKQLTNVHEAFLNEVSLSKSDRLLFKSADGTEIEGWITYPYNYRLNAGPYPLIVSSHGGPHAATTYGLNFKNQYFAANGYFVLETNFRSSTNYGEKFLWATWGAWGTKDGQDVMAGIDYAISNYPIDKSKVASIGHSYGGFMTNWLIGQYPDRFAAAASGAGIVNWTSDYANSDIPVTKEMEFWGAPWDAKARETMIKQSPMTYANRVKAPTLFINGEIDQRVPYSENQQYYVALKKNGVPTKMIQYADQPHGIAGSWNAVHRMLNERRWFDVYLKTGMVKQ